GPRDWRYEPNRPLLLFNEALEVFGVVGMFVLVSYWMRRSRPHLNRLIAATVGFVAAAVLWFNPVMLLNGHSWPQWDNWVVPFYIWSIFLASVNRWVPAGF